MYLSNLFFLVLICSLVLRIFFSLYIKGLVVWITSKTWVLWRKLISWFFFVWYCLQLLESIIFGIQIGKFQEEGQTPEGGLGKSEAGLQRDKWDRS